MNKKYTIDCVSATSCSGILYHFESIDIRRLQLSGHLDTMITIAKSRSSARARKQRIIIHVEYDRLF